MAVTPTGPLSLPLENLRQLVASSTSFQTWTGAANQSAAAARVHLVDLPEPAQGGGGPHTAAELAALRPCAIVNEFIPPGITYGDNFVARRDAEGDFFIHGGKVTLRFEADVPQDYDGDSPGDSADAKIDFMNNVGAVLMDMLALQGADGRLSVLAIRQFVPASRSGDGERDGAGDSMQVEFVVEWGP